MKRTKPPSLSGSALVRPALALNALRRTCLSGHSIAGILLLATISGNLPVALAQPTIATQPRNVAVLPSQDPQTTLAGQDIQFRVTASGATPLKYQWRFTGVALKAATANSLRPSSVSWSDLGRYDVEVSDSEGTVVSKPAYLMLATRWTEFVVFSFSDTLVRCNGPPWSNLLADRLGVPLRLWSVGGANSATIRTQITN